MKETFTTDTPVGQWVREMPSTSRIFEKHGIDFCCGGKMSLSDACVQANVAKETLLAELHELEMAQPQGEPNLDSLSLAELCDAIVSNHHEYLKQELPRLTQMIDKVLRVHGDKYPWLVQVQTAFTRLRDELIPHMFKEEQILFPAIRHIESSQSVPAFPFGSIDNPIHMMEHEHDLAGNALAELREVTQGYQIPEGACNTFRAMLDGLRELELDMHLHIHKENNVLFPKAHDLAEHLMQRA